MNRTSTSPAEVVTAAHLAYREGDRDAAERLYAPGYVFISPQDDHIDRSTFFERCFPTANVVGNQRVFGVQGFGEDQVFVYYEYDGSAGDGRYRNTEVHTVIDGLITRTWVFFGGAIDATDSPPTGVSTG